MTARGRAVINIGLAAGMAGALAACAATKQRASGGADAAAGAGAGSSGTAARDGGGGGTAGAGGLAGGSDGPGRVIGADALGDAACAVATQKAEQVPLDIYVMMDSSGSMLDFVSTTGTATKWTAVRAALIAFLQDPQSAGIGVGLQYFPLLQPGVPDTCETTGDCAGFGPCDILRTCSMATNVTPCASNADCRGMGTCVRLGICGVSPGYCAPPGGLCSNAANDECLAIAGYCVARDRCDVPSYTAPAVEVAPLPGAAAALVSSLNQHMPDGLTPTSSALAGAVAHAQALARANPTHKVVVLLATDGLPSECAPTDITAVAAIAAAAQSGSPAVSTYVIGVFAPDEMASAQANLDTLAAAGGTGRAFIVSTNSQNVTQSFVAALNAVRSSSLACQYAVPAAAAGDGGQLDYFSVNVQFTSGAGQTVTIGNVKDRASCSATQGGWYYDADPAAGGTPKTISVCDTSCSQLRADPVGRVDVLLGCKTVIIVE